MSEDPHSRQPLSSLSHIFPSPPLSLSLSPRLRAPPATGQLRGPPRLATRAPVSISDLTAGFLFSDFIASPTVRLKIKTSSSYKIPVFITGEVRLSTNSECKIHVISSH